MGNDQKFNCIVTEPHNFKILSFLQNGYHNPQLKNIAIPATAFSPYSLKILPTHQLEFFGIVIPLNFFWR